MSADLSLLIVTASSIGFMHTLLGPDHYVPFIMLSRVQEWSRSKTVWVTVACGLGHVGGSIILGLGGIALGMAATQLVGIESRRGELAAWLLIGFGVTYTVWALWNLIRKRTHTHAHVHTDGTIHQHSHTHEPGHHVNDEKNGRKAAPWVLFIIFVFGPCEPLIPLLIYPAAVYGTNAMLLVCAAFSAATILTMLALVWLGSWGVESFLFKRAEKFSHLMAGAAILASGLGIQFLGI